MFHIQWPKTGPVLWVYNTDLENAKKNALDTIQSKLCENDRVAQGYFEAGTHPDFRLLEVEKGTGLTQRSAPTIKIEAVRDLNEWVSTKPLLATCKMALIIQAENLNIQAGNALLKTLEESAAHTQIVLLSHQPSIVLPTIRSRCYTLRFKEHNPQEKSETLYQIPLNGQSTDPQLLLKDLFRNLWLMGQNQAHQGLVIQNKAYWSLVDKILQSQRFLNEGAPLNKELLISTLSSRYAALMPKANH